MRHRLGLLRGQHPGALLLVAAVAVQQLQHLPRVQGLLPWSFPAVPLARRAVATDLRLHWLPWKVWWQNEGGRDRERIATAPVEVPLVDGRLTLSWQHREDDEANEELTLRHLQPLPSAHLPSPLSTPHVYGMDVSWPLYRHVVRYAANVAASREPGSKPLVGHVAHKPNADTWVGAIGCTAQIRSTIPKWLLANEDGECGPEETTTGTPFKFAMCRGYRRFVVSQVLRTIPYPVALVEELLDTEPGESGNAAELVDVDEENEDQSDDEDTDSDPLDALEASELVPLLVRAVKEYVELQLNASVVGSSDVSLLVLGGGAAPAALLAEHPALDAVAVWEKFQSSLSDVAPLPRDRYYAVAMLAAELADVDAATRRKCLVWTDGTARLRLILKKVRRAVGLQRARRAATSIADASDEPDKDLLPPWAMQIKRGTRVEYYRNEENGWCEGVVADDPILVFDELVLTVHFTGDGTTHRLPFTADEKVRWRPAKPRQS